MNIFEIVGVIFIVGTSALGTAVLGTMLRDGFEMKARDRDGKNRQG